MGRPVRASPRCCIFGMHDTGWRGEYHFLEQPVHRLGKKERRSCGTEYRVCLSKLHLLDNLTVYRIWRFALISGCQESERESLVCDVLDISDVGKRDLYPSQLSGGQQQLVGVAERHRQTKVILADELTGNLH